MYLFSKLLIIMSISYFFSNNINYEVFTINHDCSELIFEDSTSKVSISQEDYKLVDSIDGQISIILNEAVANRIKVMKNPTIIFCENGERKISKALFVFSSNIPTGCEYFHTVYFDDEIEFWKGENQIDLTRISDYEMSNINHDCSELIFKDSTSIISINEKDYKITDGSREWIISIILNDTVIDTIKNMKSPSIIFCEDGERKLSKALFIFSSNTPTECEYFHTVDLDYKIEFWNQKTRIDLKRIIDINQD